MTEDNSETKLTEIPASDILEKIKKGEPAEYDHVTIVGDLDLIRWICLKRMRCIS